MSFFKEMFGSSDEENQTSKIGWKQLTDLGQLDEIVEVSTEKPVAIFKHSTRCIVSRTVLKQFENEFNLEDKITPYFLDLLNHRDISNEIASRFGVEHQSPQLILIKGGKAVYAASHENISAARLEVL